MLLIGLFVVVVTLGVLALIPKTHAAMQRHKRLIVILVSAFLALVLLHPYILGLPGRIGEIVFMSKVHDGMTKRELLELVDHYGGREPTEISSPPYELRGNTVVVQFETISTLCVGAGNEYVFYFSANDLLERWRKNGWETAC